MGGYEQPISHSVSYPPPVSDAILVLQSGHHIHDIAENPVNFQSDAYFFLVGLRAAGL